MKHRRHPQKNDVAQTAISRPLCRSIRPLLLEYMSRELDAAPSALVREHLRNCAACSAEAAQIKRTLDALRAAADTSASDTNVAGLTPRRRTRTLWLMGHPIAAWFFLHRRFTGILCALIVLTIIFIALMQIKLPPFLRYIKEPRIEVNITPSDMQTPIYFNKNNEPPLEIDEPPLEL